MSSAIRQEIRLMERRSGGGIWDEHLPWDWPLDWQTLLFGPPDPSKLIINDWTPGSNNCPGLWPFSFWCKQKILADQTQADKNIYKITDRYWDPFAMATKPGATELGLIHELERRNLAVDAVLDGGSLASLLADYPYLAQLTEDQVADVLSQIREQNNRQIDQLLQQAAQATSGSRPPGSRP